MRSLVGLGACLRLPRRQQELSTKARPFALGARLQLEPYDGYGPAPRLRNSADSLTDHLICTLRPHHVRELRSLVLGTFLTLPRLAHKAAGACGFGALALVMGHQESKCATTGANHEHDEISRFTPGVVNTPRRET